MTPKQRKPAGFIATSLAIIGILLTIVLAFAAMPLSAILVGMGFGYVLELFTGDYVVQAFNTLGLTKVESGDLPKVFGLIALVSWVLRLSTKNSGDFKRKGDE